MPVPTDHTKPLRISAKENAFNQLQQWIIDGTLHPGEKLNDTELAGALGVSRTPIRESLQLLEVQGFVRMYPGKATQVTEVDKESITDLLPPSQHCKPYPLNLQSRSLQKRRSPYLKVRIEYLPMQSILKITFLL